MNILGLMSGTSLDGTDLALCNFDDGGYRIIAATTVPYDDELRTRLSSVEQSSALEYAKANVELGHYYGKIINAFINEKQLHVDAIASHGHTIFHQTQIGLTTQIGDGNAIAAETGLPVVYDFRTLDVALGGQGAPLVPIGDELLFGDYDACLNLGGIANISYRIDGRRIAFDVCPCNMVLNRLAAQLGLAYDPEGRNARLGNVNNYLNEKLNNIDYYSINSPKSLGKEWFLEQFWPWFEDTKMSTKDLLATAVEHIAMQIALTLRSSGVKTLLVTGGGALNSYLIERISSIEPSVNITIPDKLIVNYKEALIFAFLGCKRLKNEINTLSSVTGAKVDSIGGVVSGLLKKG